MNDTADLMAELDRDAISADTFDIIWIEIYDITIDAVIALPYRMTDAVKEALRKGHIKIAKDPVGTNQRFLDENDRAAFAKTHLKEILAKRKQVIADTNPFHLYMTGRI